MCDKTMQKTKVCDKTMSRCKDIRNDIREETSAVHVSGRSTL